MSLKETCDLVDQEMRASRHDLPAAVTRMLPLAAARGNQENRAFGLPDHKTQYLPGYHHEMAVWYVSLMLAEYLADLLGRKVEDGHCRLHRKPPKNARCREMRAEHLRMLQAYRADLEGLVRQVRELEKTLISKYPDDLTQ